jgi:long-subunit fatty acid transport protein
MWIRAGLVYHLKDIDVIGDYSVISDWEYSSAHRMRVGAEFMVNPQIALRAGVDNFMPSVGAGLNYSLIKRNDSYVDYAFVLGKRGEGISHVFTYVFTF